MIKKTYRIIKKQVSRNSLKISTTTGFFRNRKQLDTITNLVDKPKSIYVFGCSEGCEAYSLAISYYVKSSYLDYMLYGYDINNECIEVARKGLYRMSQINYYNNDSAAIDNAMSCMKNISGDTYKVIEDLQNICSFEYGNILDVNFMSNLQPADIILCQNVLIHLPYKENIIAINNIVNILNNNSLLVIGGMRPSFREKISKQLRLKPIEDNCEEIHESWLDCRKMWNSGNILTRDYFALEPFKKTKDWPYRYSTLFTK